VELIVTSRILLNLATVVSHFATLTVGNISHHIFKMDALYRVTKYCALVKTKARRALNLNTV